MPKQDRGAPPRPPWLPEEDEQRGFLRSLRRKKRNPDEDETNEDSLTHETERPATSKTGIQEPFTETVTSPAPGSPTATPAEEDADSDQALPHVSKYYTPPRAPEPSDEPLAAREPEAAHDREPDPVPEPDAQAPRIVRSPLPEVVPEPQPIPQVEQLSSPPPVESPAIPEAESVAPETAAAAPPAPVEPESPVETAPPAEQVSPLVSGFEQPVIGVEQVFGESSDADPFSRFSLLEAQLRQMSLDESITDDELERHRRHAMPRPEPVAATAGPLSFTPPEAVDIAPEPAAEAFEAEQAATEPPAEPVSVPTSGFTPPESAGDAPVAAQEAVTAPEAPEPVVATSGPTPDDPEPAPGGQDAESAHPEPEESPDLSGQLVPEVPADEHPVAVDAEETPAAEPSVEVDDADARAAALLQRIEAKRAELDQELAAHDAAEAQAAEPEPAPFVPMVAPWASVPEPVRSPEPYPAESADEAGATPESGVAAGGDPELEGFAPLVDEDIVISAPAVYDEVPADPAYDEDVAHVDAAVDDAADHVAAESEPLDAVPTADPEPQDEAADVASEPVAEASEAPAAAPPEPAESAAAPEPQAPEPSPWQAAAPVEPPAQPAYYVPPVAPQQPDTQGLPAQEPAAQVSPGWGPPPPHPEWQQGVPQGPQPYGGQQFPSQPPPQPTSVQGQWQWVPQEPQHPVQQEPPAGYVPPPQGAVPPANYRAPQAYRMPPSLDEAEVINRGRYAPRSGWRKAVHRSTGGRVNPGDSRKDRDRDQLLASIRQPILGDYRIAVLSIKGGVGKTTTTLGLGSAFATIRTDRIIAVDANPDRGTLAERVRDHSTQSTVRDLLNDRNIRSYADVRNHTRMATSRLEVLASEQDPAVSEAFGEIDYRNTIDILQRYYNIILTDCGTGIMHSAMAGVLDLAHTIVLVSSPAMDSARSASATLDWLMQHGHSALVREAHVVLSASRPGSAGIKLDKVYEHFQARCRSIHMIPFDPHLAEGADVDFNLLNADTNVAYLKLAGAISESFPRLRMRGDEQR